MENQAYPAKKMLMPIVELFKQSFEMYWKKIWLLAEISLFGLAGFMIMAPLALVAFLISYQPFRASEYSPILILFDALLILIGFFFCILFGIWARASLFYAIKDEVISFKQSLVLAWENMTAFFWLSFLVSISVMAGFLLFFIPGVIALVWFSFAMYMFIFEGIKGVAALERSRELVRGYWWSVFGRLAVVMVVALLVSSIKFFGPLLNLFFVEPFILVYMYMFYQDLKRVKQ